MTAHPYAPSGVTASGPNGPIITRSIHAVPFFPDPANPAPIRTAIRTSTGPGIHRITGPKQAAAAGLDVVLVAYATARGVVHIEDSEDGKTWTTVCKLDICINGEVGCRFRPALAYYRATWDSPHAADMVLVQSQLVAPIAETAVSVAGLMKHIKSRITALTGGTVVKAPPAAPKQPTTTASITVSHAFTAVPPNSHADLEVPLEGAEWGMGVTVAEGFQRVPGVRFRASVVRDGAVCLYCENRTDYPISVPMAVYGLTVS